MDLGPFHLSTFSFLLVMFLGALVLFSGVDAHADLEHWRQEGRASFETGALEDVVVDSVGSLVLASFEGRNLAQGAEATSGTKRLSGSSSVTDGNPATEWRFGNKPDVLGQWVLVDLGADRVVTRVKVRPGEGAIGKRPEFFLRGYRIEVAREEAPNDFEMVANGPVNTQREIDTTADSTWVLFEDGEPAPFVGRYVRVVVTREHPPHWPVIGEIEVYGEGVVSRGTYTSAVHAFETPVNVGKARWRTREPKGTRVWVQVRTSSDGSSWPDWEEVAPRTRSDAAYAADPAYPEREGVLLSGVEPASYVQVRATLETAQPLISPALERVEVDVDRALVMASAQAWVRPDTAWVGVETLFTYGIDVAWAPGNRGMDYVRLDTPGEIVGVRWEGGEVPMRTGGVQVVEEPSDRRTDPPTMAVRFAPSERIASSGTLEIAFRGIFFAEYTPIRAWIGDRTGSEGEAYFNPQNVSPGGPDTWTVRTTGLLPSVLLRDRVWVTPNPFHVGVHETTTIQFDLAKVERPRPVTVRVMDLSGRVVRTLWGREPAVSGRKRVAWDGRDEEGQRVPPGMYLFAIEVSADVEERIAGTITVVY